jgi:2,4-dienoyl-CoA reductase-like NADH-dependent reductase (Old Yellow Enzyme family)
MRMSHEKLPIEALFSPFRLAGLELANRFVMAPMTRCCSPGGVPGAEVAAYYARRAMGGVGLIVTEGASVSHPASSNDSNIPKFHGDDALHGWERVAVEVHRAGGRIMPQLWHAGLVPRKAVETLTQGARPAAAVSPSGFLSADTRPGEPMTVAEIEKVVCCFADAAEDAMRLGFDGIELQGAHGYLIDQFLWETTNRRTDAYGGSPAKRARFATEIVAECRRRTSPDFPIVFRFSQWKQQDYSARLAATPDELEQVLAPLVDAGVDAFHCSQRRYWQPEFADSSLTLAGWTKALTGKPVIIVGSVGLDRDLTKAGFGIGASALVADLGQLPEMLEQGQFDLVAVGRAMIANADWCRLAKAGRWREAVPYSSNLLQRLH